MKYIFTTFLCLWALSQATQSQTTGSGVYLKDAQATMSNSIVLGNKDIANTAANLSGSGTASYSCIEGGATANDNINTDPTFVSTTDFRLQVGSPCIDAGNDASVPAGLLTDLEGNARELLASVDMGAFEFACTSIIIDVQPVGATVCPGSTHQLSVTATGTTPSYQWQKDGTDISGATTLTYDATEAGVYRVRVGNACTPDILSDEVAVVIRSGSSITTQPLGATLCEGSSHTFRVEAEGSNLNYQWYVNGQPIEGATSDSLAIASIQSGHQGSYRVSVSGDCSTVLSEETLLWVATPLPSELEFLQVPTVVYPNESYRIIVGRALGFYSYVKQYSWSFSNDKVTFTPESLSSPNAWLKTGKVAESGTLTVRLTPLCGEERTLSQYIAFRYPTGMDALNTQGVKVFPSPVSDRLEVTSDQLRVISVVVTDMNGKVVYQVNDPSETTLRIAASHWAKGVYLVKITTESGSGVEKVIKY